MTLGSRSDRDRGERGAAAVEFAIVLPLLLIFVGGIVDFGRLFYAEIMVTNAAREGARMVAMGLESDAQARAVAASPNIDFVGGFATPDIVPCPSTPGPTDAASYTASTSDFEWLLIDAFADISAPQPESTATMRCWG